MSLLIRPGVSFEELSRDQKSFLFDLCLHEGQDWKDEISKILNIEMATRMCLDKGIPIKETEDLISLLDAAVVFYTATWAEFSVHNEDRHLIVKAEGYRMGPAGDH